ncbi:MAG: hypothetical protein ABI859_10395 [Pseudomonadota bacterium]
MKALAIPGSNARDHVFARLYLSLHCFNRKRLSEALATTDIWHRPETTLLYRLVGQHYPD